MFFNKVQVQQAILTNKVLFVGLLIVSVCNILYSMSGHSLMTSEGTILFCSNLFLSAIQFSATCSVIILLTLILNRYVLQKAK